MPVSRFCLVTLVMAADLAAVLHFPVEVIPDKLHYLSAASFYYLYAAGIELADGSLTYVSGQHQGYAHFLHVISYARFASAPFRACKG